MGFCQRGFLAVPCKQSLASCRGCWQLVFSALLQGVRRTPAPSQFRILLGEPFMASGVSEAPLLSHSPFRVSGAWGGRFVWHGTRAGAMDVASRASGARWFAEPFGHGREGMGSIDVCQ